MSGRARYIIKDKGMNITGATAISRRHVLATLKKTCQLEIVELSPDRKGGFQWDSCVLALAAHRVRAADLRKQNFAWNPPIKPPWKAVAIYTLSSSSDLASVNPSKNAT